MHAETAYLAAEALALHNQTAPRMPYRKRLRCAERFAISMDEIRNMYTGLGAAHSAIGEMRLSI